MLDRQVRDWVLVPLTVAIFLMMLIRQYLTQVSPASCTAADRYSRVVLVTCNKPDLVSGVFQVFLSSPPSGGTFNPKEFREKQVMARAGLLKQSFGFLPDFAFRQRKAFFIAKVPWKWCAC